MAKKAAAKTEAPPLKFKKIYFIPTLDRDDPSKICQKYMVDDGKTEDGDKLRLYDKPERAITGFNNGLWGQNVANTREELCCWAIGSIGEELTKAEEKVNSLKAADEAWTTFMTNL